MSGLTLHCGLEGGRRHVPSWSDICGIRLELASFDWRGFTLPVSVGFVFFGGGDRYRLLLVGLLPKGS